MNAVYEIRTFQYLPENPKHACELENDSFARGLEQRGFELKHQVWPGGGHFWIAHTTLELGANTPQLPLLPGKPEIECVATVNVMVPSSLIGPRDQVTMAGRDGIWAVVAPAHPDSYFYKGCYQRGLTLWLTSELHQRDLIEEVWPHFEAYAEVFLSGAHQLNQLRRAKQQIANRNPAGASRLIEGLADEIRKGLFGPDMRG